MRHALNHILELGIHHQLSAHDRRRIKTINLLNLVIVFFLVIGLINYFILKNTFDFKPFILFTLLCVLSLYLNKQRQYVLSALIFTLNMNVEIFYINKTFPVDIGAYLYYYPVIVSVVLLNNPQTRDRFSLIHFLVCLVFFLGNIFTDIPSMRSKHLSAEQIQSIFILNMVTSTKVKASFF